MKHAPRIAVAAAIAFCSQWSHADTLTNVSGADVYRILSSMGMDPRDPEKDSQGDPKVKFSVDELNGTVLFYGCEAGRCKSLQVVAGFSMTNKPTLSQINEWNQKKRFSRTYLDSDGDPQIENDLDLAAGVSTETVKEFFRSFRRSLKAYASYINFK